MSAIAQHIMDILASLETENILQNQIPSPSDHKLFKQQHTRRPLATAIYIII